MLFGHNPRMTGNNAVKMSQVFHNVARFEHFTDLNLFKYAFNVIQTWESQMELLYNFIRWGLLSYFLLICQWFERMYLSGFVCLDFCCSSQYKVEGTMSCCIGTNEILASNITFTRLKVKQGQFETAMLILHNFFRLLFRLKVFRSIILKYLYDSNSEYSDGAV